MPKVVPGNEINLPDAPEVRVSTAKKNPGKILAVRHPLFGWLKYSEWTFLHSIGKLVDRIGPMEFTAWVGFTLAYKGGIDSAQAFADWLTGAGAQAAGALADFAVWWASGVSQAFGQGPLEFPPIGEALGEQVAGGLAGGLSAIGKFFFPIGELSEWFWAAIAGAISVLALKRGISP